MNNKKRIFLLCVFFTIFGASVSWGKGQRTEQKIDLKAIRTIESSDCKFLYGKTGDLGCYQITKVVVKEWNNFHKIRYTHEDMLERNIAEKVADWYLHDRIPSMIIYYKKELSVENILISYNAGIKYVRFGLKIPKKTEDYISKYFKLIEGN